MLLLLLNQLLKAGTVAKSYTGLYISFCDCHFICRKVNDFYYNVLFLFNFILTVSPNTIGSITAI